MKTLKDILDNDNMRDDALKKVFSSQLKTIREDRELSQNAVAAQLGCAVSTYANWEQGRREPSIVDIYNLIYVFKIDANELFDIEKDTFL